MLHGSANNGVHARDADSIPREVKGDRHPLVLRAGPQREARGLPLGGFIVDDVPAAGGFIVDDDEEGGRTSQSSADEDSRDPPAYTHMPLRLIPAAMRVLRMSRPDDPDNLNMFRRAAMGYKKLSVPDSELQVSRSDFRAIVAGMLDPDQDARRDANGVVRRAYSPWAENSDELLGVVNYSDIDFGAALSSDEDSDDEDSDDGDSEDEYEVSDEAMSEDDSDDEYQAGGSTRAPGKGKSTARTSARRSGRKRRRDESSDSAPYLDTEDEGPKRITLRQQEECRRTWALFFPDVPDDHLDIQRIMIKDISRVADLLKEKITTEQIIEMLDAFSTSPDKSMSLSDFEQMMVAAKLA
ncbi:hypothetical protein NM688_g8610 [Phlebia brevispora]|uniref:Uncharacterized protein n=1 Tax=Phlebia brevispora TaxID=194682 RepID=A0ACC1RTV2_9APHY|nr:hypothetical protein NM688_g8610 [Phlebia brevispora]